MECKQPQEEKNQIPKPKKSFSFLESQSEAFENVSLLAGSVDKVPLGEKRRLKFYQVPFLMPTLDALTKQELWDTSALARVPSFGDSY